MFPNSLPAALAETLVLGNMHTLRESACDSHDISPKLRWRGFEKRSLALHVCYTCAKIALTDANFVNAGTGLLSDPRHLRSLRRQA